MTSTTAAEIKLIHGVRLIRLQGSREERAVQHGRILAALTKKEQQSLALFPLASKNQSLIRNASPRFAGMRSLLETFYEAFVFQRFALLPKEYCNRLKPFQKASTLSEKKLWLALFQPDLLMSLAAVSHKKVRNRFLSGMPGCTSGILCSDKTGEEEFLFARNLDYPAAAFWEKWPSVFYHEPTEYDSQKFVSIGSLGIHTAGLTGWNESGIAFSLHAHFSKAINISGIPIFFLGEDLLEKARTLEEGIRICREFKPIGSWAVNIASATEKKAVTVELVNGAISVIPMQDQLLCHTNGFVSESFKEDEIYFNGAFFQDVRARKNTISGLLKKASAEEDPLAGVLNAISSHLDSTTGENRIFGNTVSLVTTIQSVVMDLQRKNFHLSIRPETPTPFGPYLKLPFQWADLHVSNFEEILKSPTPPPTDEFLKATHAYHEAYVAWQVREQGSKKGAEQAHAFLIQATEAEPRDPHLWLQRGYFELMHNEPKTALHCFSEALQYKMSSHYQSVAHYFQGACLDLLGSRGEALQHYEKIMIPRADGSDLDPYLRKKAEKRLIKPFKASYCQKIVPDLQFVEPLQYP